MIDDGVKEQLQNLNERLSSVEQILPTLATKTDLATAIQPLATKAELAAAIQPLATKAEVREEGERTRRHMDVIAEHLLDRMGLLYEGHARHGERLDEHAARHDAADARHDALDRRVSALENRGRRTT